MPSKPVQNLSVECALLHRYLAGSAPTPYVVEKYCLAHEYVQGLQAPSNSFDAYLSRISFRHPVMVRLGQAYARIFAPRSLARKKAVLMLAIVECCAPAKALTQQVQERSALGALLAAALSTATFVVELGLGALVLAPIQLVLGVGARRQAVPGFGDLAANEVV